VSSDIVPAVHNWPTNGDLIADVAKLYLQDTCEVFDATYGRGLWWTKWQPRRLITNDLNPDSPAQYHEDFTFLPWDDNSFDAVAYDPPYKLNGKPVLGEFDDRYGVGQYTKWQNRMGLIIDGFRECARVSYGTLLVKCQDQVVSGKVRWQTYELMREAEDIGLKLEDRFDMLGGSRPQPPGRRQIHARGRGSTLLVFM